MASPIRERPKGSISHTRFNYSIRAAPSLPLEVDFEGDFGQTLRTRPSYEWFDLQNDGKIARLAGCAGFTCQQSPAGSDDRPCADAPWRRDTGTVCYQPPPGGLANSSRAVVDGAGAPCRSSVTFSAIARWSSMSWWARAPRPRGCLSPAPEWAAVVPADDCCLSLRHRTSSRFRARQGRGRLRGARQVFAGCHAVPAVPSSSSKLLRSMCGPAPSC